MAKMTAEFPSPNGDVLVKWQQVLRATAGRKRGFRPLTGMCWSNSSKPKAEKPATEKFPSPNGDVLVKFGGGMRQQVGAETVSVP